MKKTPQEMSIILNYEKHPDGCYCIHSEALPWLRMANPDIDALHRDLDPVVKDLLLHNMGFEVESIRWIPSPEDIKKHLQHPSGQGVATYVAKLKVAA